MKNKPLIITALIFFVIVNTMYIWEYLPGLWSLVLTLVLLLVFLILGLCLLYRLYCLIREKFSNRNRIITVAVLTAVLGLTAFFPDGLVDFDRFAGADLIVAQREGAANCMTCFKLKTNNRFTERSVCFGIERRNGKYEIKNDTFFLKYKDGKKDDFAYAIVQLDSSVAGNKKIGYFIFSETIMMDTQYRLRLQHTIIKK